MCGPYLDPPDQAIVVSVDEKTSIVMRTPCRPDTWVRPGWLAPRDSEYVRRDRQNLFAAVVVHSGRVCGVTCRTRGQFELIAFFDRLESEIAADQQVVVVLGNLSMHKTRAVHAWLQADRRWRWVFTP